MAVKILRSGLSSLGDRESRALHSFRSEETRGAQHFVDIIDTFRYGNHYRIGEELYDTPCDDSN